MPKYISRKFVNGRWQYEYETANRLLSRRKRVGPGVGIKVTKRGLTGHRVGSGSVSAIKRLRAKSPTGVERKRVMSSHNRINSAVNDVRKGYGSEASAARRHERSVRESAGSAYRRDVSDSRGSGGSIRRMTQRENMRSLTRWRNKVSSRNGAKLSRQGASTDSGHRTTPTIQKSGMVKLKPKSVNPAIVQKAIRGSKPAIERKRVRRKDGQFRRSNRKR